MLTRWQEVVLCLWVFFFFTPSCGIHEWERKARNL